MAEKALSNSTYKDYLVLEAESDAKYEFHDGYIVAMAGGSPVHSLIAGNITWALNDAIRREKKDCGTYNSDLKIHIEKTRRSYYPDVTVVCDKPTISPKDPHAITNPILIFEVLSESTAAFDMGAKFSNYRMIPSLREYVLVYQDQAMVITYFRVEGDTWEIKTMTGLSQVIYLKSIGCEVKMSDAYQRVEGVVE